MMTIRQIFSIFLVTLLAACSINPATGERQFTALLSPQQEVKLGTEEHPKILEAFGGEADNPALKAYVSQIGQKIAQHTERSDVEYTFTVLDSPVANAFAVPGGYVYVTRGILALANNEAELASVIAHEIGHITGRHAAERYSQSVLTTLGAGILSSVIDKAGVSQALGLGSELYIKSYSRGQEHQADELGVRYLTRAGYNPLAAASFLQQLERHTDMESMIAGQDGGGAGFHYFSTHPRTEDRVNETLTLASQAGARGKESRLAYLSAVDGMVYGDSAKQGFVRGQKYIHTDIGFMFELPKGYLIQNGATEVLSVNKQSGTMVIFDGDAKQGNENSFDYINRVWGKKHKLNDLEYIVINNVPASTAGFVTSIQGRKMNVRVVVMEWAKDFFFRFQMATPVQNYAGVKEELKDITYSFRRLSGRDKARYRPYRMAVVTAKAGDSVESLSRKMPYKDEHNAMRFRVLNGMPQNAGLVVGNQYKTVIE